MSYSFQMAELTKRGASSAVARINGLEAVNPQLAKWSDSSAVCGFADAERHLGHIVKAGSYWLAYDATHLNETGTGFQLLGTSTDIDAAKRAVEQRFRIDWVSSSTRVQ